MSETNGNGTTTYSRKFKTRVIKIEELDGSLADYTLRSLDGPASLELEEMRDSLMQEGKLMPGAPLAMVVNLISKSLIRPDGVTFVDPTDVMSYPREMQQGLFLDALKLNGMDVKAVEMAKNA